MLARLALQFVRDEAQVGNLVDYAYVYNVDGKKISKTRTGGGLPTQATTYDIYDALDRLSQVTLPNGTVRVYAFDLDSNRTSITETPPGGNPLAASSCSSVW